MAWRFCGQGSCFMVQPELRADFVRNFILKSGQTREPPVKLPSPDSTTILYVYKLKLQKEAVLARNHPANQDGTHLQLTANSRCFRLTALVVIGARARDHFETG